jgi:LmbE family N-acetylglucosaminyl deacetylase
MNKLPFNKVLVLSPHTDDIEFGCGGTISRLDDQGAEIHTAVFSHCETSVPEGYPKDVLLVEMHNSSEVLNIKKEHRHIFDYPVRKFSEYRQDILENMVSLKKEIEPELVLTTSTFDVHQDHEVISNESIRAFRFNTLLGYELPWNNLEFTNQLVVNLKKSHIEKKVEAIKCYKSQNFRSYGNPELFIDEAVVRGIQNKRERAEIFEVIKMYL